MPKKANTPATVQDLEQLSGLTSCCIIMFLQSMQGITCKSLVDLYINTTSHEMNKVMRIIVVITALGIMPAVIFGALGTNLVGNPWNTQLGQVFIGIGVLMLILTWIFYRLGWLKK